ncbi:hypothetical protein HDU87_002887 [Geranomyces variabilis]|uniref:SH3 domain-containing protein n=1 Tax=Geranomyces variabilis TaxID=109894 RepID=A0AAD5TLM0_9FUNG|nr:hypothetical protein HDU87_002887 [Geranomyces variabilis]
MTFDDRLAATAPGGSTNTGAVVGGVIGGLVLLVAIAVITMAYIRWRRQAKADSENGVFGRKTPMQALFGGAAAGSAARAGAASPVYHHDSLSVGDKAGSMRTGSPFSSGSHNGLLAPGAASGGAEWPRQPSPFSLYSADRAAVNHEVMHIPSASDAGSAAGIGASGAGLAVSGLAGAAAAGAAHQQPQANRSSWSPHDPNSASLDRFDQTARSAVRSFIPTNADEIEILPGDSVTISQTFSDGWATGVNSRTGIYGAFPMTILK